LPFEKFRYVFSLLQKNLRLKNETRIYDQSLRAHNGVFLSFQYPVEIPGVSVTNFIKTAINENRKAKGLEDMPAKDMLKMIRDAGHIIEFLPPYSPDLNNIEHKWFEKKAYIKKYNCSVEQCYA